ncbi:hypothetical protein [Streptomyces sp. NPDC057686]|uniref:hypothetical protein n=1 Tax=Streptomyces sp. NPDC057686 TaxID=3346212 RepID=UPI0036C8AEFC
MAGYPKVVPGLPGRQLLAGVAPALDDAGLGRTSGFTHEAVLRRRPGWQEHDIGREDDFVCAFWGSDLPAAWNVEPTV